MMAERNVDHSEMFTVSSRYACSRCSRSVSATSDDQLLPVPFCASRHYVCRSCLLSIGAVSYCPGCVMAATPLVTSWTRGLNGTTPTDANGNGASADVMCGACGRRTDQPFHCQSCADAADARPLCNSCSQQHQLDFHVLPRLRLDAAVSTTSSTASSPQLHPILNAAAAAAAAADYQRLATSCSGASILRQIRPRVMMSTQRDHPSLSSLLDGLTSEPSPSSLIVSSSASSNEPAVRGLLPVGLHDPSVRHRRLAGLQSPLSRQYEGWLWQALNNGGFDQASQRIDERKQHIGVNLQSTLRDMEFRLERARAVLDELYREYMRQVPPAICL